VNRRAFAASGLAATACSRREPAYAGPRPPVVILKAPRYDMDLAAILLRGLRETALDVKGKRVLLKPNFVEFSRSTCINTNPALVAAAIEAFESLGASVDVAEGPGHRRDTLGLAELAGYRSSLPRFDQRFTDLNRDDVTEVRTPGPLGRIYLPNTALRADLIVSMAKMKTHHWAGATLSMKNFFGLVPGSLYGWPKNYLHHIGIPQSIVGLNRIFTRSFAIVDGIVGMQGNGPIQGTPKQVGAIVMGPNLPAVDATCCRIMGIDPGLLEYLTMAPDLGPVAVGAIEQRGEPVSAVATPFDLIPLFSHIRKS
jgi:uncharacterized protein (DUF362 family)